MAYTTFSQNKNDQLKEPMFFGQNVNVARYDQQKYETFEKLIETQKQYNLKIPFGQDEGNESTNNFSSTMYHYRTGGTPWFILIDQEGKVVFNDFHLNTEKAIEFLKTIN